jgi:CubicO group peptidase (beta-lactamase class C family)
LLGEPDPDHYGDPGTVGFLDFMKQTGAMLLAISSDDPAFASYRRPAPDRLTCRDKFRFLTDSTLSKGVKSMGMMLMYVVAVGSPLAFGPVLAQTSGSPSGDQLASQISRVETGLPAINIDGRPPLKLSVEEWMQALDIAGLSVAVIEDYQVIWAKGYGVKNASTGEPVTEHTLFQAASISKAVTALAVLHEVQKGVFDLDRDVNAYLRSWQLPDDDVAADKFVTLRQLLSHSAGITPGGFTGYARGARLPELTQILDGVPPATNGPARIVAEPGTGVNYSGLGYTIIQLVLVDQLGRAFPEIMNDVVMRPLGLSSSTFSQTLAKATTVPSCFRH